MSALPGGTVRLAADLTLTRVGYGAMQLAGPGVFGPPKDRDEAIAVLREVVDLGITHIDTAEYYGPHVTNELIREALYPYPEGLHIVTKVGATRDARGGWPHARSPEQLRAQVHENLRSLRLEELDVVNLRLGGGPDGHSSVHGEVVESFGALADLQREGLIRHLGISTVDAGQIAEAQAIAPVVCVQNWYNLATDHHHLAGFRRRRPQQAAGHRPGHHQHHSKDDEERAAEYVIVSHTSGSAGRGAILGDEDTPTPRSSATASISLVSRSAGLVWARIASAVAITRAPVSATTVSMPCCGVAAWVAQPAT